MEINQIKPVLEMRNISKSFPGVIALDDVSFDLYPGEIHALLGENGAGKSTLVKILGGVYNHDAGEIFIDGKPIKIDNPIIATKFGIAIIHQELNLIPALSVADNILLGKHPKKAFWFIDEKRLYNKSEETLQDLGLGLSPKVSVGSLTTASGQLVLIGQALARKPRFLVMDEPTAALGDAEIDYLFGVIKHLASQGVGIIYISHKLDEIFRLSDRVTVLRDGKKAGDRKTSETHREELINLMVGRELKEMYPKRSVNIGGVLFEVHDFLAPNAKHPVSFKVHKGEILGLFGLLGAGRTRLVNSLYGVNPGKGMIILDGKEEKITSPADACAIGLGLMPIERKKEGLVMSASIENNILLSTYPKYARSSFMKDGVMAISANNWIDALRIRCTSRKQIVLNLSGGNQQKAVLGRLLEASTKVLILNSPTQGIDVGAKVEIYNLMGELCAKGKSIIFITSELPELLGLSDRILVMAEGRITGEFNKADANQEKIMHAAIGEEMVVN